MFCAFSGSALVGLFTPRLVAHFQVENPAYAYFLATGFLSTIAVGVILLSFAFTEEHIQVEEETHASLAQMLKMISTNIPFLQAMGGIALFGFASVAVNSSLAYFIQYYMGEEQKITGNVVFMIQIVQMISILPWTVASRYMGKRAAWIVGLSTAAAALVVLYLTDRPSMQMVYILFAVYAAGCGSIAVNFWSIVPDSVEYGEWRTGVRAEGFIFGFVTLVQKVGLAVSSAFVGAYLGWVGYVANQPQTATTLASLKLLITLIAVLGLIASCVVIYFYRLNTASHAQMVREIAGRPRVSAT
jgi:GPH family glycoside/pentoside/hexuronide:cation symporter